MQRLKNSLITPFADSWKLLLVLSLPALVLCVFGLHQLNQLTWANAALALPIKLVCEFCFLGLCLAGVNLLGLKNKWLLAAGLYLYYISLSADITLLWYFKERFGAKYLNTLAGGDYTFLTDWRVSSYLLSVALFSVCAVRRYFTPTSASSAFKRLVTCAVVLAGMCWWTPLQLLSAPADFYTTYLLPPSIVYTTRAVVRPTEKPLTTLTPQTEKLAEKYNIFTAKNTGIGKSYKRVILIASESLSNKYLHRFNSNIPPAASEPLDNLMAAYPSASLRHVSLSTLFGLSVIFTSHPFVQIAYENDYPVSMVRLLKENGFHTAFLRGANETYMDENILFEKAGFEKVIGATYFQTRDDYKKYVNWWGLLDRKLFDYAIEYMQEHKDKPLFLTLLTLDSHVPLGRPDYLDQTYEEIDNPFYQMPTMPRAFARFGQDVERFLTRLKETGLLDKDTLVLITPDHPSYSNTPTNALFEPYQPEFDNLPFIIVTKNPLSQKLTDNPLASQLDIAPTVLDLLNITPPKAFFGHSLFDHSAQRSVFDIKEDYAVITTTDGKQIVPLYTKKEQNKDLLDLMRTFVH